MTSPADIITAISQLIFAVVFLLMFLGVNQRIQVMLWARDVRAKLSVLRSYAEEARKKAVEYLSKIGARDAEPLVNRIIDYFVVTPVDIEPIDIIKRLERVLRTRDDTIRGWIRESLPDDKKSDTNILNNAETLAVIASQLNMLYRLIRHYLMIGLRYNNWALIMQLVMLMPLIMRVARSYREAVDVVMEGRPIGDGAGPLAALLFARKIGARVEGEVAEDTVYYRGVLDDREVFIVKARGPGSTVGRPGVAVEKLVEMLGSRVAAVVTVDAMVKLEGEETGSVAVGAGVAMGDPGPEKIRIERLAVKLGIPLHAIGIKMAPEEAVTGMKREVYEGVRRAVELLESIVKRVEKGKAVIVVGVGNTLGVAQ